MKLAYNHFPKRNYIHCVTPLQAAPRLSSLLGGPEIFIKRDDTLEGGNKTRKLEFVIGEAIEQGADTLLTCGALQSNHCQATLGFANREGLECHLVLKETVPGSYRPDAGGNNLLFHLMGAASIKVIHASADMDRELATRAEELQEKGRRPFIIPTGASTPLGALGYVCGAREIMAQAENAGISLDHIVVASGSGGTHAGLLVGLQEARSSTRVTGINVLCGKAGQEKTVRTLAEQTLTLLESSCSGLTVPVMCLDEYLGGGYTLPSRSMIEAVKIAARNESLLLDPVYSGKAMAGLIDLVGKNYFKRGETVIFLHTGGLPALFEYKHYFLSENDSKPAGEMKGSESL